VSPAHTWVCVSPSNSCLCVNAELPAPIPSISVSPSGVFAPGGAVTIRCQCRCGGRRLFLYKDGIEIRELDSAGDGGEFTIPNARREDRGYYMCRSHSRSEPPNWWYPSDIVYAKPSISLSPSGGVPLGGAVTIRCWGWYQNMRFLLYKDGNPNTLEDVELAGGLAEFLIRNMSWRHAGNYSCYYYHHSYPATWSHPSDPVELVVGPSPLTPARVPLPLSSAIASSSPAVLPPAFPVSSGPLTPSISAPIPSISDPLTGSRVETPCWSGIQVSGMPGCSQSLSLTQLGQERVRALGLPGCSQPLSQPQLGQELAP
uniref:Ig-like domain-containing protein n=1 Tax=Chrysemys picta bellii TaxID=8478 RepID=A0A8C3FYI0_CHRPI